MSRLVHPHAEEGADQEVAGAGLDQEPRDEERARDGPRAQARLQRRLVALRVPSWRLGRQMLGANRLGGPRVRFRIDHAAPRAFEQRGRPRGGAVGAEGPLHRASVQWPARGRAGRKWSTLPHVEMTRPRSKPGQRVVRSRRW